MNAGKRKKRVFITGAAGNWGGYVLREFTKRADEFDVVALVLPTEKDIAAIRLFEDMDNLTVTFGDLTDYSAVARCVEGSDYVLHIGAVVSPLADMYPELAHTVNIRSAENIVRAVKAQPRPQDIGVVMIGTIAETGDRNPPHHWGRVGDPLRVAQYDEYGQSKIIAEKTLVDSGLPKWAWLRQTGIFHPGILEIRDPIMTHSPFDGVMEWVSAEDAARLLANICQDTVPQEFWNGIYNIGGGEGWRLTNWQLQTKMTRALGVKDVRRWYERNWFATRNFHGQWYTDSDRLHHLVPFRQDSFDAALARAVRAAPASVRLAGKVPATIVKNLIMKPLTLKPRGTMSFLRDNDDDKIAAYFGSRAEWEAIGDWSQFWPPRPDRSPRVYDHGYDESLPVAEWSLPVMQDAAVFRGGAVRSKDMTRGDIGTQLEWTCADGHDFTASPRLVLLGGHWCPTCVKDCAGYKKQSETNRFLAQVES